MRELPNLPSGPLPAAGSCGVAGTVAAFPRVCAYLLAIGVLGFLVLAAASILSPASYNYVEGDTATWIYLIRHGLGDRLYQPAAGLPMWKTNYPPLYLNLIAHLARSDASIPLVGRVVSGLGFLGGLFTIGLTVRTATADWRFGALAMALCGLSFRTSVCALCCYPDALAFGVATTGVALAAHRTRRWPIFGALCFTLAVFIKQSLIIFPCGVLVWALLYETRKGLVLLGTMAALISGGLWRFQLIRPLILDSIAPYSLAVLSRHLQTAVMISVPAIVMAVAVWRARHRLSGSAQAILAPWFAIFFCGLPWLLALGREGSSENYMAELVASLAVILTVARGHGRLRSGFALLTLLTVGEALACAGYVLAVVLPQKQRELRAAQAELATLRAPLVLAEPTWYAISAGIVPIIIPFLGLEQAHYGRWDPAPLCQQIRQKRLTRALLGFSLEDQAWRSSLPEGVFDALRESYTLASQTQNLHIYRPRQP